MRKIYANTLGYLDVGRETLQSNLISLRHILPNPQVCMLCSVVVGLDVIIDACPSNPVVLTCLNVGVFIAIIMCWHPKASYPGLERPRSLVSDRKAANADRKRRDW